MQSLLGKLEVTTRGSFTTLGMAAVTIPEDLPLNSAEDSVLSKGLTFVPTVNKTDEYQVKADSEKFFRRLRLKAHFMTVKMNTMKEIIITIPLPSLTTRPQHGHLLTENSWRWIIILIAAVGLLLLGTT